MFSAAHLQFTRSCERRFHRSATAARELEALWADGGSLRLLTENKRLIEPVPDENKVCCRGGDKKKAWLSDMKNR